MRKRKYSQEDIGKKELHRKGIFSGGRILCFCMAASVLFLNAAAWNSTAFCDWYIAHIFPVWVNTYGRITGLFPFSVGEWLIAAGMVLAALALVLGVFWIAAGTALGLRWVIGKAVKLSASGEAAGQNRKDAFKREQPEKGRSADERTAEGRKQAEENQSAEGREPAEGRKQADKRQERRHLAAGPEEAAEASGDSAYRKKGSPAGVWGCFRSFSRGFYLFFGWTFLTVCLIMTLNCFILYHASTFSEHYFGEDDGEYTLEELIRVYNMAAEQCNRLAQLMDRDETGMVLYGGSVGRNGELLDMEDMAREMMARLGETYSQLDGYYPRPKALLSSDFMCQQHMQGYYFPFSMEANYNDVMHILNFPSTMCHELAHLRGYIYEDEANFIGYLACVQSDDIFFQYAGYLSVLVYLNNDIYYAWRDHREIYDAAVAVVAPVTVDEQVWTDNVFVTQEEWDRINKNALLDTEVVDKAADVFIDANLKINGIADGKVSYSRVVRLLLQYYRQEGLPG